jgi:hypothetical protein
MAAVTTNYGFDVPTSSDLVKNGATQIALLGQDIDTFLFRPFTKNVIINGGFDIWQRGTSFGSLTDGAFFADRWAVDFNGTGATRTVSRQEIAGAWATSSRYFMRYAQSVAGSGGTYNWFHQRIEDVTTLAGQNVVISFWAKADASRSVDVAGSQVFGGGGSSQVNFTLGTAALTTTWTKFSFTVALGSMSGKTIGTNSNVEIDFKLPLNTAMTIDIGDVQLEAGSQATPFSRAGGTLQGELAACQRYLPAFSGSSNCIPGYSYSTTGSQIYFKLPVTARVAPTGITVNTAYGANYQLVNQGFTGGAPTALAFNSAGTDYASINVTTTAGSPTLVVGQWVQFQTYNGYILFTGCEL